MGKTSKKIIVFFLLMTFLVQACFTNQTIAYANNKKVIALNALPEPPLITPTGDLAFKIALVYPENKSTLDSKKFQLVLKSGDQTLHTFNLKEEALNQAGTFTYKGTSYSYIAQALNAEGVPITTESLVYYLSVEIKGLPLGTYFATISGEGYTTYDTQDAILKQFSQQVVVATNDGRFMIGDANQDGIVDKADRALVEDALSVKQVEYKANLDFNDDNQIDIVDLAMVNRHIDVPKNDEELFDTSLIMSKDTLEFEEINQESFSIKSGSLDTLFQASEPLTIESTGVAISESNPLDLPISFKQPTVLSQININTLGTEIEQAIITATVVDENGAETTEQFLYKGTQPEGVYALSINDIEKPRNTVVISLGRKVAVKKVVISVQKVKNEDNTTSYITFQQIEFLKDIVPSNPQSNSGVVTGIEVTPGSSQITLNWKRVANITGYKVYISDSPGTVLSDYTLAATIDTTTATVKRFKSKELENYKTYYFVVTSTNGDWESAISKEVIGIPLPNSKPMQPDNVKVTAENQYLILSWQKAIDANGYNIYYKKAAEAKTEYKKANEKPISETNYIVAGLENGVEYTLYVTGTNEFGEGPGSIEVIGIPNQLIMKDPGIPTKNRISSDTITSVKLAHKDYYDQNSYPNGDFSINNVIDGDFSTHWTARAWWEDNGLTFTFDREIEMNFLAYVPRLNGNYPKSISTYDITVWTEDDITNSRPGTKIVNRSPIKTILAPNPTNNERYAILEFPKSKVKQIKVATYIYNGAPTNTSLSEIAFYEYYDLIDNISALFTDNTYTALKSNVTLNDIQEIRATLEEENSYYVNAEILAGELDLAESLLPNNESKVGKVITGIESMKGFQPLGITALAQNNFVIYASIPAGEQVTITPTQYFAEAGAWKSDSITLQNGRNVIQFSKIHSLNTQHGGPLYIQYSGDKGDNIKLHINNYSEVKDIKTASLRYIPILELYNWNELSEKERKAEIQRYITELEQYVLTINPNATDIRNTTEISLPNVLLSIPASTVKEGLKEFAKGISGVDAPLQAKINGLYNNALAWNEFMDLMYTTNGVDKENIPTERRENIRYMRMFGKAFMYAAGSHVGVGYGSTQALVMGKPTSVTGIGNSNALFGWGIAHEIGHNKDTLGHVEITNNIYSLFAQTKDGGNDALVSRVPFDEVFQKTAQGYKGASNNVFVQLGMYWQLHLAYDNIYQNQTDNFYYNLNKKLKENRYKEGYTIDERFAIIASEVAQKDLTDFFQHWGLTLSDEAKAEIKKQGNPEEKAIYYLDDSSRLARINNELETTIGDLASIKANAVIGQGDQGNRVTISWDSFSEQQQKGLQGVEIIRGNQSIAFVRPDQASYVDIVGAANNLAYDYAIQPIGKQGSRLQIIPAGEIKLNYDVTIDRNTWEDSITKDETGIHITMNKGANVESIAGIRISDIVTTGGSITLPTFENGVEGNITTTGTSITITATVMIDDIKQSQVLKRFDFSQNDSTNSNTFITYFNKPGTNYLDTRIWTYDVVDITISGLPDNINMNKLDFIQYPGDNITITENGIGILKSDYVYGDKETDIIPKDTLVVTGTYRGDPMYNTISVQGKYLEVNEEDGTGKEIERDIPGYVLLFAEVPDDGKVSEISDGIWIFVPDIQGEAELQDKDLGNCNYSILPAKIQAKLYRTDDPNNADSKRLTSNTIWYFSPSYDTMPSVIIE